MKIKIKIDPKEAIRSLNNLLNANCESSFEFDLADAPSNEVRAAAPTPKEEINDLMIYYFAVRNYSLTLNREQFKSVLMKIKGISESDAEEMLRGYHDMVAVWFAKYGSLAGYSVEKARQIELRLP